MLSLFSVKSVGGKEKEPGNYDAMTVEEEIKSRDRPKSAPYPRLKNSKKTSKCQVFFYSTRNSNTLRKKFSKKLHTQKMDRVARRGPPARAPGALKGGHFRNCQRFCRS